MNGKVRIRRAWVLLCVLAVCCLGFAVFSEDIPLEVYLIDPCGGCQGGAGPGCGECRLEDEAYLRYRALLQDLDQPQRRIRLINLRRSPGIYDLLKERLKALGHGDFRLPIVMIGEAAFPADGSADAQVRDFLTTGIIPPGIRLAPESVTTDAPAPLQPSVVYLYSRYCEDCRLIAPWLLEHLPEDIQQISFDIGSEEGFRAEQAVRERFKLSDEDFVVPALVVGDRVLLGSGQIQEALADALPLAHQTPLEMLIKPSE